jgi:transcriptional regulator with XRE-family HTH domain
MFEGSLGEIIREFRKKKYPKLEVLARELGYSDTHLGKIENEKSVPDLDLLLNLYVTLVSETERHPDLLAVWLIKWFAAMFDYEQKPKEEPKAQKAQNDETHKKGHRPASKALLQQAQEIIGQLVKQHEARLSPRRKGQLRSLENFPDDFLPLAIITGDRRHTVEPRGPGDVFVKSAATTDLMFLPELGLPKGRRITTDRIFALMKDEQLRRELGQTNILVIGSGIVNLATRVLNEHCLFRFKVTDEAKRVAEKVRGLSFQLAFESDLNSFRAFWQIARAPQQAEFSQYQNYRVPIQEMQRHVREIFGRTVPEQYIQDFGGSEFIDPAGEAVRFASNLFHNRAIVSLGRNPYAEGDRFVTIMAAGTGALGTAHAVRALTSLSFDRHPFGGILDAELTNDPPPKNFEEATCKWIDPVGYTPDALLEKVKSAQAVPLPGDPSLSALKPEEISKCRDFIWKLTGRQ